MDHTEHRIIFSLTDPDIVDDKSSVTGWRDIIGLIDQALLRTTEQLQSWAILADLPKFIRLNTDH